MTTPAGRGGNGVMAASGVAELGARTFYGEGALVACDRRFVSTWQHWRWNHHWSLRLIATS
jgi:hypothetical protein